MARLLPYVILDGNAKEAVAFYEKALQANVIGIQTFGEMPENPNFPLPDEAKDRVSHAMIKVGDTDMMFSDTFPGTPHVVGNHVTICIMADTKEQATEYYQALQEGGKVTMPLQETFWSPAYGIVIDKYGVTFQISTESQ
ncbi:VOC family protein [Halalkalibacter okhensis]|uniref:3-demethylubiquinone-9 3-methyltransferase n=1 Tax=Halalkalibacter okhensis TaxID=333138 RepID=A0A0B0IJ99_9BACI|nr:VOC family protein [Halalkalibacter okhensis]KHF40149.1 3-demethylubiquinone-9 3-methyltransferase [Halalkalibacter okhensis]